ncbi:hypothetical protein BaRGS_00027800, partial [Batillaria attramentaria]
PEFCVFAPLWYMCSHSLRRAKVHKWSDVLQTTQGPEADPEKQTGYTLKGTVIQPAASCLADAINYNLMSTYPTGELKHFP